MSDALCGPILLAVCRAPVLGAVVSSMLAATPSRADFNGNGLAVSDIFDFLNAWFAGC